MKKIIAIAVIFAGVVLLTIGNTIQMYSTISIIEQRLAEKEQAVDTVSTNTEPPKPEPVPEPVSEPVKKTTGDIRRAGLASKLAMLFSATK